MTRIDQILQEVARLPEDQRLTLAHRILEAGEPKVTEDVQRAWDVEIRERIGRYDRGEARSRPATDVFRNLDSRLGS